VLVGRTDDRERALAAGANEFLVKPFRAEQLFEMLERHLGIRFERG